MQSFEDEERDGGGSPMGSSDNDADETMEDLADNEMDADNDAAENDEDNDENDDNDEDDQEDNQDSVMDGTTRSRPQLGRMATSDRSPTRPDTATSTGSAALNGSAIHRSTSHPNPTVLLTSPSPHRASASPNSLQFRPSVRPEALTAPIYDIAPTIAAPHSTSINTVTATPDLRWVFTGGSDGYIRKFNWIDTANGKLMLTVAQRHPFVDSVTKAGVLVSYWENEEPQMKSPTLQSTDDSLSLSPVYSLAVHSQGLWLLSGLESGGINLQSVRHDEGKRITCLRKHTSAVSVLTLTEDEKCLLSGSWDKTVQDWDLNTGQVRQTFQGSGGQISTVDFRPSSALPVPGLIGETAPESDTFMSNNEARPLTNGIIQNGIKPEEDPSTGADENGPNGQPSPADSLFGGHDDDSLFGDNEDASGPGVTGVNFGEDEDDEFSRAIANGIQPQKEDDDGAVHSVENPPATNGQPQQSGEIQHGSLSDAPQEQGPSNGVTLVTNGLPHAEEINIRRSSSEHKPSTEQRSSSNSNTVFLAASIDGIIRIWDRRQAAPVAHAVSRNAPPWCMNACWSPDGNFLYAGRRNGTVEEFSLHKGFREPERTFKFPQGSGAVSAVKAMPNGQHLICASFDILRLYDLKEQQAFKHSTVPFLIVPGHRGGVVSSLYTDPTCKYLISTSGNRGWEGSTTEVLLGYEIGVGT
ncbi:MAG: hypothetical protein M4579_004190 [Chaenotheca gracillima]|nr:MAG: hypothetical protein M4579_004190 [Chaenotheca gracillima]